MALVSMTGFARTDGAEDGMRWHWEIRTVNGRNLDVRCRLASGFEALEPGVRRIFSKHVKRGSCQVALSVRAEQDEPDFQVNDTALKKVLELADRLQRDAGLAPASVDGILALRGVVQVMDTELGHQERTALETRLLASLEQAVSELVDMRAREGGELQSVLVAKLDEVSALTEQAKDSPARSAEAVKQRLSAQVERLLEGSDSLDEERLHQEAVLLATRSDVTEELDRLTAHIGSARDLMQSDKPVGRRFEFLLQEFNREANTLCSKVNDASLTAIGLDLKTAVDQMREQVLNIE